MPLCQSNRFLKASLRASCFSDCGTLLGAIPLDADLLLGAVEACLDMSWIDLLSKEQECCVVSIAMLKADPNPNRK
jgi:hypothetical protein